MAAAAAGMVESKRRRVNASVFMLNPPGGLIPPRRNQFRLGIGFSRSGSACRKARLSESALQLVDTGKHQIAFVAAVVSRGQAFGVVVADALDHLGKGHGLIGRRSRGDFRHRGASPLSGPEIKSWPQNLYGRCGRLRASYGSLRDRLRRPVERFHETNVRPAGHFRAPAEGGEPKGDDMIRYFECLGCRHSERRTCPKALSPGRVWKRGPSPFSNLRCRSIH